MDNEEQIEETTKKKASKQQIDALGKKQALKKFLEDYYGRALLYEYLENCGVNRTVSHAEPHKMALYSGLRDAGLIMQQAIMEADHAAYLKMVAESKERDTK